MPETRDQHRAYGPVQIRGRIKLLGQLNAAPNQRDRPIRHRGHGIPETLRTCAARPGESTCCRVVDLRPIAETRHQKDGAVAHQPCRQVAVNCHGRTALAECLTCRVVDKRFTCATARNQNGAVWQGNGHMSDAALRHGTGTGESTRDRVIYLGTGQGAPGAGREGTRPPRDEHPAVRQQSRRVVHPRLHHLAREAERRVAGAARGPRVAAACGNQGRNGKHHGSTSIRNGGRALPQSVSSHVYGGIGCRMDSRPRTSPRSPYPTEP